MYTKPKGTKDLYGKEELIFSFVEKLLLDIAKLYNFSRIRTPLFEDKNLFVRTTGKNTEIVKKEMYEFQDKKGRYLALKPEGTAPTLRAYIENKLYNATTKNKLFYFNSMYRYERPQKGRQREFYQFGVEHICDRSALDDVELIQMSYTILNALKIKEYELQINCLGSIETQQKYIKLLKNYLKSHFDEMGDDAKNRLDTNPLRILDDKKEMNKSYYKNIPSIMTCYSVVDKKYWNEVISILDALNIKYVINDKLVRGLDYYSDLVFEFVDLKTSGSQNTFIGGGRYQNLISKLGGPDISGIGFAIGIERLISNINPSIIKQITLTSIDVFVANISSDSSLSTLTLVELLRNYGFSTESNFKQQKLKKAFKLSQKYNPKFVIIFAPKEIKEGKVIIKNQLTKKQETIIIDNICNYIEDAIGEKYENSI